jgi:hypothetical protein
MNGFHVRAECPKPGSNEQEHQQSVWTDNKIQERMQRTRYIFLQKEEKMRIHGCVCFYEKKTQEAKTEMNGRR